MRYPSVVVAGGGLLVGASALGDWPVDDTAALGIAVPIIAVLAAIMIAFLVLAVARWNATIEPRLFAGFVFIIATVAFLIGAYGYAEVLGVEWTDWLEELVTLLPPVATIFGGAVAAIGALGDLLDVEASLAKRRSRATGLMAVVGFSGLVSMLIWSQVLFIILIVSTGDVPTLEEQIVVSNISLGVGMATVAGLYLLLANRNLSFIDLKLPSLRDIGWVIAGLFGVFIALLGIVGILELLGAPAAEHDLIQDIVAEGNPEIVLYVLIPGSILIIGPGEELLFRNIIQKSLYDHFSRPSAVILASGIFALAHIPAYWAGAGTITAIVVISTLSLVLGAIYAKTENIIVPVVVHGLYNAIQFGGLYWQMTSEDAAAVLVGVF